MEPAGIDVTIYHATLEQVRANGLGARLHRYNKGFIGDYEVTQVAFDVLTPEGELCGGLRGVLAFGWLITELLWVAPASRGRGIGAALCGAAEELASDRGIQNAWLAASPWHDILFLQANGYTEFAAIRDYANGAPLRLVRKSLTQPGCASAAVPNGFILQPGSAPNERLLYQEERSLETGWCGSFPVHPLRLAAKDKQGRVVGGLNGDLSVGWLKINVAIVDEDLRGRGVGTLLLNAAEKFAADSGARGIWLETFDWQAPGFYKQHGYEQYARLENYIAGQGLTFLKRDVT
jgi:ribosomal protein S18 acetylase RimI-like enzyme